MCNGSYAFKTIFSRNQHRVTKITHFNGIPKANAVMSKSIEVVTRKV